MAKKSRRAIETRHPEPAAPGMLCPDCESPLTYRKTTFGVLFPTERWDAYDCLQCNTAFEYRHRTRTLRKV